MEELESSTCICLACGESAVKRARVPACSLLPFLKSYLTKRCEEKGIDVDLDAVINDSSACCSCANKFITHEQKDTRLYEATEKAMDYLICNSGCSISVSVTPKRLRPQSVLSVSKRICAETGSPPVVVSKNIKQLPYLCKTLYVK